MYRVGKNRLFYESKNSDGRTVEIQVLNPLLEKSNLLKMNYLEGYTYYIDIWFRNIGSHLMKVYENGEEKNKYILLVSEPGLIIYPDERLIV